MQGVIVDFTLQQGVAVAILVALVAALVWGFILKDPPILYTPRQYREMETRLTERAEKAEGDSAWFYSELMQAYGVQGKAWDALRRRELGDDEPMHRTPPTPFDRPAEPV